jgi:hypothetical protein
VPGQLVVVVVDSRVVVNQEMEALYDERARLLSRADAFEPESETAKRIAEVDGELQRYEDAEAEQMRRAFESSLPIPIDSVESFNAELREGIARAREHAASPERIATAKVERNLP